MSDVATTPGRWRSWAARWAWVDVDRPRLTGGAALVVLGALTTLLYPQVLRRLVDEGIVARSVPRVEALALLAVLVLLVQVVLRYLQFLLLQRAAREAASRLQERAFANLLRQEVAFFDVRRAGELAGRVTQDALTLENLVAWDLAKALRSAVFVVACAAVLLWTSTRLTVLVLLVVPPLAALSSAIARRAGAVAQSASEAGARAHAAAHEALTGIRTVRAHAQEEAERARFGSALAEQGRLAVRRIRLFATWDAAAHLATESALVATVALGGRFVAGGELTPGQLVSFLFHAVLLAQGVRDLGDVKTRVAECLGATAALREMTERVPAMALAGGARPERPRGALAVEGVRFRYPARPEVEVLRGVDLTVRPGELVALVGASGAGKSTLLALFARLYDPDSGRVTLDGQDLRALDPSWLRSRVALVGQDAALFTRTLVENVRYAWPGASEEAVRDVMRRTGLDEVAARLPGGEATLVGDRGTLLSGGQRQRVALARALLGRPLVLALDEATNALDSEAEERVKVALRDLEPRPAVVLVAHRLATVADADRVVLLADGRVQDEGTHHELLRRSSSYRQLVRAQLVA